jgi:hypothetical protein
LGFWTTVKRNRQKLSKTENQCYRLPCGRTKPAPLAGGRARREV